LDDENRRGFLKEPGIGLEKFHKVRKGHTESATPSSLRKTSVPHIHTIINLAHSIFLETARKID
jgi:hypothetical protein